MPDELVTRREKDLQFEREALRWIPDVARFALSLARNEADAEDLVQETYPELEAPAAAGVHAAAAQGGQGDVFERIDLSDALERALDDLRRGYRRGGRAVMKPMLDCDAVMRQLWDYLDGELSEERMQAFREHVEICGRCHPQLEFERTFPPTVAAS